MLCAECLRCGRRSIISREATPVIASPEPAAEPAEKLRCDMCGGHRIRLVRTESPASLVAFIAGRG